MKSVLKQILAFILLGALLAGTYSNAKAQKMTEVYIPLGQSPGVSGISSGIGTIQERHESDSTIVIAPAGDSRIVIKITDSTAIYLDKSKIGSTNSKGTWSDIKPGLLVEAKYRDNKREGPVEWIKLQIE